jgi:fumarylacetoacetate (FAA) hydrolase family protein
MSYVRIWVNDSGVIFMSNLMTHKLDEKALKEKLRIDKIRQRAYELWQMREKTGAAGDSEKDWEQAEREIEDAERDN